MVFVIAAACEVCVTLVNGAQGLPIEASRRVGKKGTRVHIYALVPSTPLLPSFGFRYFVSSQLGFKTAVGMPFKDIATSDSVYLEQLPATDDKNARTALRRMQEVKSIPLGGLQN